MEKIIFLGNPGVGKSTILSTVLKEGNKFKSGINIGEALTQKVQGELFDNKIYLDTPGLDDIFNREKAAKEIMSAFKEEGTFKICFVIILVAGRVRGDDVITIKSVIEAINQPFYYGIIINELENETEIMLKESIDLQLTLAYLLGPSEAKPSKFYFMSYEPTAKDKNGVVLKISDDFKSFLCDLPSNAISNNKLQEIRKPEDKLIAEMEKKNACIAK